MRALWNTDLNTSLVPYLCQLLTLPILLTNLLRLLLLKILPPRFCYLKLLFLLWDKFKKKRIIFCNDKQVSATTYDWTNTNVIVLIEKKTRESAMSLTIKGWKFSMQFACPVSYTSFVINEAPPSSFMNQIHYSSTTSEKNSSN